LTLEALLRGANQSGAAQRPVGAEFCFNAWRFNLSMLAQA
jgi:hypothetical protein